MREEDSLFCEYRDKGKKESFDKLFKLVKPWLYRVIYRITNDKEATKDIIQDTWITVLDNMYKYDPAKGSINNLIYTIAKNKALQLSVRYLNNSSKKFINDDEDNDYLMPKVNENPEILKIINERNSAILSAVNKLSSDYQDVIILHYFGEFSVAEISEKLSKPIGTIKTNLARGREKLKQILSKTLIGKHLIYADIMIILLLLEKILN